MADVMDRARTAAMQRWPYDEDAHRRGNFNDGAHFMLNLFIERRAEEFYNGWSDQPDFVPWTPGGNSDRQDIARRLACDEIEANFLQKDKG